VTSSLTGSLFSDPPALHGEGSQYWGLAWPALRWLEQNVEPGMATLETGAGSSTMMLAARGADHEAVTPSADEAERIRAECGRRGIPTDKLRFRIGPSHEVLPTWEPRPLDLVLVDGAHGFPYPILDWWHLAPHVQVGARNAYGGLYFIDQFAPLQNWSLTLAGRYNVARVVLRDRSGLRPALDGEHSFRRFNPALGVNWNPRPALTWFASLTQGMRVPAPAELTCADATAPCLLPNQFLADPALKAVTARTVETGVRLRPTQQLRMSAALYRSVLSDDIQFITSGAASNAGFFQNTGATLRQGLDLTVDGAFDRFHLGAAYSYVRAEYLSEFRMRSPNNSSRDAADEIAVQPGNAIPGVPQHSVKLALDWTPEARTSLGFGWAWFGRQYARGDENNRDVHGALPSYSVAQAFARYRPGRDWELSLKVDNLFDRRYQSFGVLGRNFFTGSGGTFDAAAAVPEQFVAPGAPRAVWLALRYEMDRK